jgi:hypothetical protein
MLPSTLITLNGVRLPLPPAPKDSMATVRFFDSFIYAINPSYILSAY